MSQLCSYFDPDDGCKLRVVLGIPTKADCDGCSLYHGPARGLGDQVATAARVTGIEALVRAGEKITKRPCGCQERREALNRKYPRGSS